MNLYILYPLTHILCNGGDGGICIIAEHKAECIQNTLG